MIRLWSSPVAALAALGVAMVPTAAPDRTPPRIVSAVMVDLNRNARAERVRLTYSERVRHARDNDGNSSFVVVGYRVLVVGAATGRSLVLLVKERVSADSAARPAVRYRKTSSKPVLDGAGNQASAQAFRLTRAHGHVPPVPTETHAGSDPRACPDPSAAHRRRTRTRTGTTTRTIALPTTPQSIRTRRICPTWALSTPTATASTEPRRMQSSPRRTAVTATPGTKETAEAADPGCGDRGGEDRQGRVRSCRRL